MYIVFELQLNADGTLGTLITTYTDMDEAESNYHRVLMSAAISKLPMHTCMMLNPDGHVIKSECYRHKTESEE